ncbi:hypothetical protein JFV30_32675 [Pseudomonas sp. TH32]|uniref:hypothetical protein n=1 Tax=Pseudomonas sp. TH32 TaxID=2796397 RepID=UPI001912F65F|nr:hypothetical protein [Pseudomonas sp. TH32]MBK5441432.1 hypothetical protein [Pseudomonas sp. TH32]
MALTIDSREADELSRLLNDPRYDARHDIWLWLWLNKYHDAHFDSVTCNGITMRETLASYLSERSGILESVNSEKDQFLVPDSCLRWIDGNERQSQWLLRQIEPVTDQGPAEGFPRGLVRLTGKNRLIAMFDLWKLDVAEKVIAIGHLRADWLEHEARDRDFEWFKDKKETTERCKCAWEWLEKNDKSIFKGRAAITSYDDLLIYFDKVGHGPQERKYIVQKIKNRWSRKQFDQRAADKKQCNVMLSKKVIHLLDELSEKHSLKRAQVLERLVTAEAESGDYLAENLKSSR